MGNTLPMLRAELQRWPEVKHRIEDSRKHPKLYIEYKGRKRFLVFSKTKVQSYGLRNKVSELRRLLRDIQGGKTTGANGRHDHTGT